MGAVRGIVQLSDVEDKPQPSVRASPITEAATNEQASDETMRQSGTLSVSEVLPRWVGVQYAKVARPRPSLNRALSLTALRARDDNTIVDWPPRLRWLVHELLAGLLLWERDPSGVFPSGTHSDESDLLQTITSVLAAGLNAQKPPWGAKLARVVIPLFAHPCCKLREWVLAVVDQSQSDTQLGHWLVAQLVQDSSPLLQAMWHSLRREDASDRESMVATAFWANLVRLLGFRQFCEPQVATKLLVFLEAALCDRRPMVLATALKAWRVLIGFVLCRPLHAGERGPWTRALLRPLVAWSSPTAQRLVLDCSTDPNDGWQVVREELLRTVAYFFYRYLRYTNESIRSAIADIARDLANDRDLSLLVQALQTRDQVRETLMLAALHRELGQPFEFSQPSPEHDPVALNRPWTWPESPDALVDEFAACTPKISSERASRQRADRQLIAREWLPDETRVPSVWFGPLIVFALLHAGNECPPDPSRCLLLQRVLTAMCRAIAEHRLSADEALAQLSGAMVRFHAEWSLLASPFFALTLSPFGSKRLSPACVLVWLISQSDGPWPPWLDALAAALPDLWVTCDVLEPANDGRMLRHLAHFAAERVATTTPLNEGPFSTSERCASDASFALIFGETSFIRLPALRQSLNAIQLARRLYHHREWIPLSHALALLPLCAVEAAHVAPELIPYLYRLDPNSVRECLLLVSPAIAARLRRNEASEPVSILKTSPSSPNAIPNRSRDKETGRPAATHKQTRHVRFREDIELGPLSPLSPAPWSSSSMAFVQARRAPESKRHRPASGDTNDPPVHFKGFDHVCGMELDTQRSPDQRRLGGLQTKLLAQER
ncbi:hypothetical protein F1559_000961 [Cyanidiococcus yangmingshanensis]|uniref:Uncharacterized protein n=1 Tax=Cyanidiococcus yangmingshanensis TaxID=2690220 RepID=A0A7J7II17_9RHOD|nr:hypothetical protein F1559_000961 [Cyanidiococcus yangmingshanensis]